MKDERRLLQPEHVQALLAHIDVEEVALRKVRTLLEQLPADAEDLERHREFRAKLEAAMADAAQLAEQRTIILGHTGRLSGLKPEQLSLSALICRASSKALPSLVSAQRRLRRIVRQIQSLSSVVGWVLNESRTVQLTVIQALTGEVNSDRYTASGRKSLDPTTVRFETRS